MTDQPHADEPPRPELAKGQTRESQAPSVAAQPPTPKCEEAHSPASDPVSAKKLSAEEQMALYEKDLKENDWGHQPC